MNQQLVGGTVQSGVCGGQRGGVFYERVGVIRSIPDAPLIIWIIPFHKTSVGDVHYDSLQGEHFSDFISIL